MGVNRGFPIHRPEPKLDADAAIDGTAIVACGKCGRTVPSGRAHILVHPAGPNMHVMYCPDHCPCRRET